MDLHQLLARTAAERNLRQSTVYSYRRLLMLLGVTDDSLTLEDVQERLYAIDSPNTRRAAAIAARSVLNMPRLQIPKGVPRRYVLPSEETLRMALMFSPHEPRGLLMMYAGLRIGEACAVTSKQRNGDRLTIDRQVIELHASAAQTGGEAAKVLRLGPVKTNVGEIVIPHWLCPLVDSLDSTVIPSTVRESLRRAGKKLGVSINPHMLRHWYATTALERGMPLSLVSKQLRHSDVSVTLRTYSQHSDEDVHRAFG